LEAAHTFINGWLNRRESIYTTDYSVLERKERAGMVAHNCKPSYVGGIGRRTEARGWPRQKHKTLSEK
jgi:hypothetical protein